MGEDGVLSGWKMVFCVGEMVYCLNWTMFDEVIKVEYQVTMQVLHGNGH